MKIVCDACSAKYSISDDKVQGKVFKIRCKKCSNIIVVRGTASAAAAAEPSSPQEKDTRVFDYGYDESSGGAPAASEAVWHVVIDQDQVGPLSVAEVQKRFTAGEIDTETYIWREGFADWLPIGQVDVFSSLFSGASASAGDDSGSLFGTSTGESRGGASAVNDLFGGGEGSSVAGGDDDGDVFAARRSPGQGSSSAASSGADSKLRGERGENSVLFSLSNLAQLASDGPRPQQSSTSSASSLGSAQHGGGEGSGLIDIRSMANAYLSPDKSGAKSASPSMGSAADLPVFSSSGFGEPAVIVPIVRSSASNNNKLIFGLVGLVGVMAVVAVVMVVILLQDKPVATKPEQVAVAVAPTSAEPPAGSAAAPGTPAGATMDPPAGTPGTPAGTPAETPDTPSGTAGTTDKPSGSTGSTPDKPRGDAGKRPSGDKGSKATKPSNSGSTKPPADDPPPTKPSKPSSGGGDCDAVACLVDPNQPCCAKKGGGKPSSGGTVAPKPDSNLPEQLDSGMIKAGIDKVKGSAQGCGGKSSAKGAVKVRIKATPEGKVGSVEVVSSPDDALGRCVASALKNAKFAKTQRGMVFAYTLSF